MVDVFRGPVSHGTQAFSNYFFGFRVRINDAHSLTGCSRQLASAGRPDSLRLMHLESGIQIHPQKAG
ncbi:MAG TPA: hypothetical protein DCG12_06280 [Planctomycetaceae bacterium]|nr:hypothetical protein [Planctomycetaceae bacterium]